MSQTSQCLCLSPEPDCLPKLEIRSTQTPTIVSQSIFNAEKNAATLYAALKDHEIDTKNIIKIISKCNNDQRQEISTHYKKLYDKDLISDFESKLSGNFKTLIVSSMTPLWQLYARQLHEAIVNRETDEAAIEILCTKSSDEICKISKAYAILYGKSLVQDLNDDTSGKFNHFMIRLCTEKRSKYSIVDHVAIERDAVELDRDGKICIGTENSVFQDFLISRHYWHLSSIFAEYAKLTGHSIITLINKKFTGDYKDGILAIVQSNRNASRFLTEKLYECMAEMVVDHHRLIRLVVTRSEVDLEQIKTYFKSQYNVTLGAFITNSCCGEYAEYLKELVNGNLAGNAEDMTS